ncbi:sigma factor [Pseudomonas sp.]|uniref:sigma factor n=1 Tax=Pseudomonas sp. TaxID=306 RepID=UPI0028AADD2D|nr:sigma factor [Pseudomonas sp.]
MASASSRDSSVHGDIQALYVEHHAWLQGWLWRRIGCRSDAADLTQDTFLRLFRPATAPHEPDLRQPRAYLATQPVSPPLGGAGLAAHAATDA